MGGPNLEVFKVRLSSPSNRKPHLSNILQFGMYIMFPIGFMYYFGVNLDSRFAVPDFWPKGDQTHKIPFERGEIAEELERLKQRRLAARARRLEIERQGGSTEVTTHQEEEKQHPRPELLEATKLLGSEKTGGSEANGWFSWLK